MDKGQFLLRLQINKYCETLTLEVRKSRPDLEIFSIHILFPAFREFEATKSKYSICAEARAGTNKNVNSEKSISK